MWSKATMAFREAPRGNDLFDIPVADVPHNAVLDTINRVVDYSGPGKLDG
jgi:hypothetical protein